jgi:DNA repair protein RadC
VFCALWLNNRHAVIEFDVLFQGTVDGTSVHPREVVKRGLALNAAAVIFAHNHRQGRQSRARRTRQSRRA